MVRQKSRMGQIPRAEMVIAEEGAVQNRAAPHVFASTELAGQTLFAISKGAKAQGGLTRYLAPGEARRVMPGPNGGEGIRGQSGDEHVGQVKEAAAFRVERFAIDRFANQRLEDVVSKLKAEILSVSQPKRNAAHSGGAPCGRGVEQLARFP